MHYITGLLIGFLIASFITALIEAIKIGNQQADNLQRMFGNNAGAALRYTLTGRIKNGPPNP